jgi:hypothetical protein
MAHSYAKLDSIVSKLVSAREEYRRADSMNNGLIRGARDLSAMGRDIESIRLAVIAMVEAMMSLGFRPDAIDRHTVMVKHDVLPSTNKYRLMRQMEQGAKRTS